MFNHPMLQPSQQIEAIQFINAKEGFLGGNDFILRTTDGGQHWQKQRLPGYLQVNQFDFINTQVGWAVETDMSGASPMRTFLFQTTDAGVHWHRKSVIQGAVHFVNRDLGFAGASYTENGGLSWHMLHSPKYGTVSYASLSTGFALVTNAHGYDIEKTVDGGKHWRSTLHVRWMYQAGGFVSVESPSNVWVRVDGGYGMNQHSYTLYHTLDGGRHWSTVIQQSTAGAGNAPGVVSTDSPNRPGPGTIPGELDIVNGTLAFMAGDCPPSGQYGMVTVGGSRDGTTWQNQSVQLPGYQGVVSFLNGERGWLAVSAEGPGKLPPALYETKNGGKTWTKQTVF